MADELFDNHLAREMTLGEAVEKGILPMPIYVPVWYDIDGKVSKYQADIDAMQNGSEKDELNEQLDQMKKHLEFSYGAANIFKKYMPHDHGKYIVFCRSVEHIKHMEHTVIMWLHEVNTNVHSYISISEKSDKSQQLQAFRVDDSEDAIKLLFTVDRLNEGLHISNTDGVIMLRPTISPIIYLQQMGRALTSGNRTPVIFDLVNNYQNVMVQLDDGKVQNVFEKEFRDAASKQEHTVITFKMFEKMIYFNDILWQLEDVLHYDNEKNWIRNLELFDVFNKEFGREPKKRDVYQDKKIGQWCCSQRKSYHQNKLSNNRISLLQEAEFKF